MAINTDPPSSDNCDGDKTERREITGTSERSNQKPQNQENVAGRDTVKTAVVNNEGESIRKVGCEICFPFLLAGLGMVLAGALLDSVQYWPVFDSCPQLFILVPALLGLKGNLEMTLASRLSTLANLLENESVEIGNKQYWLIAWANVALVQVQAVVVGTLAAIFALFMHWLSSCTEPSYSKELDINEALMLTTSSVLTASIASFVLGIIMVIVVHLSKLVDINPDNVATPIAASLGDLVTLAILAYTSSTIHSLNEVNEIEGSELLGHSWPYSWPYLDVTELLGTSLSCWTCVIILLIYYLAIAPGCFVIAKGKEETKLVLFDGWTPVLSAMIISSLGGTVLNQTLVKFPKAAAYQPVINGVAGNLVAVHASRISTDLHQQKKLFSQQKNINRRNLHRISSSEDPDIQSTDKEHEMYKAPSRKIGFLLWALVVPGHLVFNFVLHHFTAHNDELSNETKETDTLLHKDEALFHFLYLVAALTQVGILLFVASPLVLFLWHRGIDPDSAAIPYLTSSGDLLGGLMLSLAFHMNERLTSQESGDITMTNIPNLDNVSIS